MKSIQSRFAEEREKKLRSLFSDQILAEREDLSRALGSLSQYDSGRVGEALEFAMSQHYGDAELVRYYVAHPIRVTALMARWLKPSSPRATDALVASLVHNAIEKKVLSPEQLAARFGAWVRDAVVVLTPDREAQRAEAGKSAYYSAISRADAEVQAIKIFDKIDNLLALCINPDAAVREAYLADIEKYLRPLAARVTPDWVAYLDELVRDNRELGYYRPTITPASAGPL